jgi:DNA-binding NarL/FixJ family response regulator
MSVIFSDDVPIMPTAMKNIMRDVCVKHRVYPQWLVSGSREVRVIHARREYVYRCRNEVRNASLTRIGKSINKDHTTVLYALRVVSDNPKKMEPFTYSLKTSERYTHKLTPEETIIFRLLERGLSHEEMVAETGISSRRVSDHKFSIKRKTLRAEAKGLTLCVV